MAPKLTLGVVCDSHGLVRPEVRRTLKGPVSIGGRVIEGRRVRPRLVSLEGRSRP